MQSYMPSLALLTAFALPLAAQEPQCQNINAQAQAACNTMVVFADIAAGVGIDHYTSAATIHYFDGITHTVSLDLANTREVLFVNGGLTAGLVKLVVELGYQTGTDQSFATTFSDFDPKAGHVFWGAGLRINF